MSESQGSQKVDFFVALEEELAKLRSEGNTQLLAELPVERKLFDRLEASINRNVERYGSVKVAQHLAQHLPHTLLVYLTGVARFRYQGGEYWPQVGPLADTPTAQQKLRENLLPCLKRAGYPTFEDVHVSEAALRYVTPILLHACIPTNALDRFFQKIVWPIVRDASRRDVSDEELRVELLEHEAAHEPKFVRRFLQYGGGFALDFTRRAAELVADAHLDPAVARADVKALARRARLPEWVVEEFKTWWQGRDARQSATGPLESFRWVRPHVVLDPFAPAGEYLLLVLPAQKTDQPRADWAWHVNGESIPVRVTWRGNDPWFVERRHTITGPAPTKVELTCDGKPKRQTYFEDFEAPVRFFDARTGRQTEYSSRLLWVLMAPGWSPAANTSVVSQFPSLLGHLRNHTLIEVDGSAIQGLTLKRPDGSLVNWQPDFARLEGAPILPVGLVTDDRATAVYGNEFPTLVVAQSIGDRALWCLRLNAPGRRRLSLAFTDLPFEESETGLRLSLVALLAGQAPAGDYEVAVTGPLGMKWRTVFRFAPGLQVFPAPSFSSEASVRLELPPTLNLLPLTGIASSSVGSRQQLSLKQDALSGHFEIKGPDFSWSYFLRTPRPIFEAFGLGNNLEDAGPTTVPFDWAIDDITSAHYPKLKVDATSWFSAGVRVEMQMVFRDGDGLRGSAIPLPAKPIQFLELDSLPWMHLCHPVTALHLNCLRDGRLVATAQVATVRLGWQPAEVSVCLDDNDQGQTLVVRWTDTRVLRDRAFEMHCLTRPWMPAVRLAIPDDATAEMRFDGLVLPAGYYALEPVLVDPWGDSPPAALPPEPVRLDRLWLGHVGPDTSGLGDDDAWLQTAERQLIESWELSPYGPPFLTESLSAPDTPTAIRALWNWYLRAEGSAAWADIQRTLAEILATQAGKMVLSLAASAPGAHASDKLAPALIALGCFSYPSKELNALEPAEIQALIRAWPALRWQFHPTDVAPLVEWSPWHEQQIEMFRQGRLSELEQQFLRFVPNPDARQLQDMRLFEWWGKNVDAFEAALYWHRNLLPALNGVLQFANLPDNVMQELRRFEARNARRYERTDLLYSLMGIAALNRLAAKTGAVATPELREWSVHAYHHFGDLVFMACVAFDQFFTLSAERV